MVSALGFSVHAGRLTAVTDLFADPFWQHVRDQAAAKAMDMRRQGFFGPAMPPMSELEYGGIVTKLAATPVTAPGVSDRCRPAARLL